MTHVARPTQVTPQGRAAHDAQRALDPAAALRLGTALRAVLGGRGPVLDLGVGSGATARHLLAAGVPVLGVDLSTVMLAGLRDHAPGLPAVAGDLAALPLRDGCARAAHLSYVLHHVPDWHQGLREVGRVLAPDAVLALNLGPGAPPPTAAGRLRRDVLRRLDVALRQEDPDGSAPPPRAPALQDPAQVDEALAARGFTSPEPLEVDGGVQWMSLRGFAERQRDNPFPWPVEVDPVALHRAVERVLRAAPAEWGDAAAPRPWPVLLLYRIYRRSPA